MFLATVLACEGMPKFKPPGQCPVCHEFVPRGAVACDDCGACARSGWDLGSATHDGLDLPEDDFDYDDFISREFGESKSRSGGKSRAKGAVHPLWRWVAYLLLALLLLAGLRLL